VRHRLLQAQWAIVAKRLAAGKKPILCGPWRSEVGFELLYWIPFLNAFREQYKIDPARLIAIGRGGSAQWYRTAGTADLYEHVPVEVVRTWSVKASQQTGSLKQHSIEPWETHVCGLTAASLGIEKYATLSPSWMYRILTPWWSGLATESLLNRYTLQPVRYEPPTISPDLASKLPKQYIAMRWYARPTWPYREDLVLWTRQFVEKIAAQIPVILIDSFHADDHADINLGPINNVIQLSDLVDQQPTDNLLIQSSVIARAQAYVGTYGGMAQGAMRWGVPTVALYAEFGHTAPAHLTLTQSLSLKTGVPFICVQPKDCDGALSMVLGR
jgi:hypothetical protein